MWEDYILVKNNQVIDIRPLDILIVEHLGIDNTQDEGSGIAIKVISILSLWDKIEVE